MIKDIYQFLIWDNCNNNCQFCFLKTTKNIYSFQKRQLILQKVIQFLNSKKYIKNNNVLLCGGQIFDNLQNFNILNLFFEKIINMQLNNSINLLYINTNLIYQNVNGLYNFLNLIEKNNLFNRLIFTTSYDLQGRYKSKEDQLLFLNNLKNIKQKFPKCNMIVNTILTKKTCNSIINNQFNIFNFMDRYKCHINLLPYIIYNKNLAATRQIIFKALNKINLQNSDYINYYIKNITLQQKRFVYKFIQDKFIDYTCKLSQCNHSINYKKYSSKNTCYCCDLKKYFLIN